MPAQDQSIPAPSNVRSAEYPRINPDLSVTFLVLAPSATTVQVQAGGRDSGLGIGPCDMARDSEGVWTVTTTRRMCLMARCAASGRPL